MSQQYGLRFAVHPGDVPDVVPCALARETPSKAVDMMDFMVVKGRAMTGERFPPGGRVSELLYVDAAGPWHGKLIRLMPHQRYACDRSTRGGKHYFRAVFVQPGLS